MSVKVEVKGLKEFQRKIEQVVNDLSGPPMVEGVRDATLFVQSEAKKRAPVDTGRLRASIMPNVRTLRGGTIQGAVGSNLEYAPYIEMGTGVFADPPRKAHWPPGSALDTWAKRHGFTSGAQVAFIIGKRGGLRARKFLYNAVAENKDKIARLIGQTVGRIVEK